MQTGIVVGVVLRLQMVLAALVAQTASVVQVEVVVVVCDVVQVVPTLTTQRVYSTRMPHLVCQIDHQVGRAEPFDCCYYLGQQTGSAVSCCCWDLLTLCVCVCVCVGW